MQLDRYFFYFLSLGLFWAISPVLSRQMAEAGVPVTQVVVYSGLAVGIGLALIAWLQPYGLKLDRPVLAYGLGCALFMNVPFALSLQLAHFVPVGELALITSTSPLVNYLVSVIFRLDRTSPRKLLGVATGFLSSALLIVTRGEANLGGASSPEYVWALPAAFLLPFLYTAYNIFAARRWPANTDTLSVGAAESLMSGAIMVPFMLYLAPPFSAELPPLFNYWGLALVSVLWIVERIAFFTLIRDKGSLYTIQATYVSTPGAVFFGALFFGGGTDAWLWLSLALLMVALWFNNSGQPRVPQAATPPSA
jgi:drug/metabolite transporter (DMT)-like permease